MDAPAMLPENIAAEEGGQQQMHQDEKEHKPMLQKVKDKMKKIKNTMAGHGHDHDHDHEQDTGDSNSTDEAEVEKGGYQQQDVEDKPMYDSERIPAAAKEVKHNDAPGVRLGDLGAPAAAQEVKRDDAAGMRLGDFGDPKQVGARKMDVDVSKEYEAMPVSDGTGEEWNDAPTDAEYTGSYTDRLKNTAAGTTEYGKKLASTVYEKVAGVGTVVASKAQQVTPGFGAGGNAQDDSSATAAPESVTAGAGKRDLDLPQEGTRASYTGTEGLKNAATGATGTEGLKNAATDATGTEGLKNAATDATGTEGLKNAATDATTEGAPDATYTDMIKSAAAGTTEYGKKLASTVYEKVAGVGTAVASKAQQVTTSAGTATPGVGAQDGATTWATATPGVGSQDGATTRATVTPGAGGPGNGQDKGVAGVTAYIAEKLRPGDEERSLSGTITGAVQQRKEGVGSTVAKAREVPAQVVTRARGGVTWLTGGNRVSETVQPTTEGNIGEGVAAEGLKNAATDATATEGLKNAATDATTEGAPGTTYTDMIKSAAAGTTEYGKKLASTVYEKVAGVGTAVASKAQQETTSAGTATPGVGAQDGATTWATATPGVGAQDDATTRATVTPGAGGPGNGQDKGVTGVPPYIAEKLRPGDGERSLSEAITGAVQQRKEGVGSTVAQAVTRARGAVTSLTGGNRVSETVQPTTEGNIGEGVAAEGPVLHGAAPRTNTNVM